MNKIDELSNMFSTKLDEFSTFCDSLETPEQWDKEEYGELDVYCLSEFVSTILKIIVVDGQISEKEVDCMNKNFGFSYTKEELEDVYRNCQGELEDSFDERIREDVELLGSVSAELVAEFKGLIELILDIIVSSDGIISDEEKEEKQSIMETIRAAIPEEAD